MNINNMSGLLCVNNVDFSAIFAGKEHVMSLKGNVAE